MGRLDYAPKRSEIKITDLTKGLGEFRPKPQQAIALPGLAETLKKAGYALQEATVTARGVVEQDAGTWFLRIPESRQRFELRGFANLEEGSTRTVVGRWTRPAAKDGVELLTAETGR